MGCALQDREREGCALQFHLIHPYSVLIALSDSGAFHWACGCLGLWITGKAEQDQ